MFDFLFGKDSMIKSNKIEDLPFSLKAEEVAIVLGISRAGAYNLIKSKGFPCIKIGGRYVVPKDKLLEWIDKNCKAE